MKHHYITTDLEISSHSSFQALMDEFNKVGQFTEMSPPDAMHERWSTNISLLSESSPDAFIAHYCELITNLSGEAKKQWDTSYHKCFNFGYSKSSDTHEFIGKLSAQSIKKIAQLEASFTFTLYPIEIIEQYNLKNIDSKKANLTQLAGLR